MKILHNSSFGIGYVRIHKTWFEEEKYSLIDIFNRHNTYILDKVFKKEEGIYICKILSKYFDKKDKTIPEYSIYFNTEREDIDIKDIIKII